MARKYVDCREQAPGGGCALRISGEEDDVMLAAADHARAHGAPDSPELRDRIRRSLKDDASDWSGRPDIRTGTPEMLRIT